MHNSSSNESKHVSNNPFLRFSLKKFFECVNEILPSDAGTILDAGCGEGYGVKELRHNRKYLEIFGFDLSFNALQKASKVAGDMYLCQADVTHLPFSDRCVDIIISLEVLEHIPVPADALAEYKRVTRRYILISVPNEPIFRMLRMLRGDNIKQLGNHPEHINHWNLFSLKAFLQKNGLRVIKAVSPMPFIWNIVLVEIDS